MQKYSQQLADAVKRARAELEYTQEYVADKSDTDVRTIINIEQGRGNPKLETLFPLVHVLKMDAREIFDNKSKREDPAIRHLHLLIEECSDEEATALLPIVESVLNALRSVKASKIE